VTAGLGFVQDGLGRRECRFVRGELLDADDGVAAIVRY
jgi:hypothetical protein